MNLNLTTPEKLKMKNFAQRVDKIITLIEKGFKEKEGEDWIQCIIIIDGEFEKAERDEVVAKYLLAGWKKVAHRTSSENNERPGLTRFTFVAE